MLSTTSIRNLVAAAIAAIAAGAPLAAHAQEVPLFTWSGRVDRQVTLEARPGGVSNTSEPTIRSRARFSTTTGLPARPGMLRVVATQGRGTVTVTQQPTAQNNYTAQIQVIDNEGGADMYRVSAYWTSTDDPRYNRGNGRGYGRGNGNANGSYGDGRGNGGIARDNIPMLQWQGDVDDTIQLIWRNGAVRIQQGNGSAPMRVRSTISGAVRRDLPGQIAIRLRDGRGTVEVIQQPNSGNNYTGIIRISDPQSGYGHYSFDATWQ
jgi:hypothetical protein